MRGIGKSLRKAGSVIDLPHAGGTCPIGLPKTTSNIQMTVNKVWCFARSGPGHLCGLLVGDSHGCTRGSRDEKGERAAGTLRDLVTDLKKAPGQRGAEADEDDARTLIILFGSHGETCRVWKEAAMELTTERYPQHQVDDPLSCMSFRSHVGRHGGSSRMW